MLLFKIDVDSDRKQLIMALIENSKKYLEPSKFSGKLKFSQPGEKSYCSNVTVY